MNEIGHLIELILRKIINTVATRCQILRLKCNKFDFGWGSALNPAGGAYSAPPDSLAGFKGALRYDVSVRLSVCDGSALAHYS